MTNHGEPLIALSDLRKDYSLPGGLPWTRRGLLRAVDGVSLEIRAGSSVSLVGESGCGKTTTARMVLALEVPTSGTVEFMGTDVFSLRNEARKAYRSSVQAVFQDPWSSLNPRMRINDFIAEPLQILGTPASDVTRRVADLLYQVGLSPRVGSDFPHEFSGGQRQRIAVARALSVDPKVIVLDEPVSALDVSIRAQIMNLLKDLQNAHGLAYLLISHNLSTVHYLGREVAVMYLGSIVESGPAEALFDAPRHPYSVSLLAADLTPRRLRPARQLILKGDVPSPASPPSGCRFHTRCWLFQRLGEPERCSAETPVLSNVSSERKVACHFWDEVEPHLMKMGPHPSG